MASTETQKKDVYFNFGPDESYFFRCEEQHRQGGNIAGRTGKWDQGAWVKFNCVAWNGNLYFASRQSKDGLTENTFWVGSKEKSVDGTDDGFGKWVYERRRAPLRLVYGKSAKSDWFVWMLHGDFIAGRGVPEGMSSAAKNGKKLPTGIRCASMGVNGAWVLIWEDGEGRFNFKDAYPELSTKFEKLKSKGLKAEDVSWIALNPFREGDYFLYVDKTKTAYFQVSEAFGNTLNDALISAGITTTDVVLRKAEIVNPRQVIEWAQQTNLIDHMAESSGVTAQQFLRAGYQLAQTGYKVCQIGTKVGTALAGIALCNVM